MTASDKDNNKHGLIELKSRRQHPQTLFISCSDCQIDSSLISSIRPGEFYLIQNVGNFIPPYHPSQSYSETAGIEFALTYLTISDIIVCGHRQCAAIKVCRDEQHDSSSQLDHWMTQIESQIPFNQSTSIIDIAQRHILNQIENIKKYPLVRDRLENDTLTIHAWYYDAENRSFHEWDAKNHRFQAIKEVTLLSE